MHRDVYSGNGCRQGVFEAMPHLEDEHAYLFQAKILAGGRVTVEAPSDLGSFFVPHVLNVGQKRLGKYWPGYPLLLSLGVLVGQPWLVNAFAAALTIAGVYWLGRDLFDQRTGLLAASLGAISPLFVLLSGTLMSHSTTLAAITLFAWTFVRARRSQEPHPFAFALAAGGLVGWSAITRPLTAMAVGLAFAILALTDCVRRRRRVIGLYVCMSMAFLVILSILPLFNFAATGSPFANTYQMWWPYDSIGFGLQFGSVGDGHWIEDVILNTRTALPQFGMTFLGWPTWAGLPLAWIPVVLGLVWPPRTRRDWGLTLPFVLLVLVHMTYWAASVGRYYFESLPFLWILAARGLIKFGASRWTGRLAKLVLPLTIVWSIAFSLVPRFAECRGLYDITRRDANVVSAAHLHDALVFVHSHYWTMYANLAWLNEPALANGSVIFAEDCGPTGNLGVISNYPGRAVYYYDRDADPPLSVYEASSPESALR